MEVVDKIVIGVDRASRISTIEIGTPYAQSRGHYNGREESMPSWTPMSKSDLYSGMRTLTGKLLVVNALICAGSPTGGDKMDCRHVVPLALWHGS